MIELFGLLKVMHKRYIIQFISILYTFRLNILPKNVRELGDYQIR